MPRSDEENRAHRAWASAHARKPEAKLRRLLEVPLARPVYHRMAEAALASGDPALVARALKDVQAEVDRVAACQALVAKNMPKLLSYLHPHHKLVAALATAA
jgi:hypothetical protein